MQPGEAEVFHLSASAYRRSLIASVPAIVVGVVGTVAALAKLPGQARWWFLAGALALLPAVVTYRIRYSRRTSVQVTADSVVVTGAFRTRVPS